MNLSQADQLKAVIGWVFAAGFMFVGLVFLALGGYELRQGLKTKNWPAAPGRIIESEIESRSSTSRSSSGASRSDTDYRVRIRYSYEVAGQKLEGKRLQYGYESHDERSSAKKEQSRYPPGKEV
jgi:head-tail adaptor